MLVRVGTMSGRDVYGGVCDVTVAVPAPILFNGSMVVSILVVVVVVSIGAVVVNAVVVLVVGQAPSPG